MWLRPHEAGGQLENTDTDTSCKLDNDEVHDAFFPNMDNVKV